ncbi:nucleoid-associated protein [bacterium SCSIO 12741]|nr:nucleoid-associated protein [bacterium SCSIO 12741]
MFESSEARFLQLSVHAVGNKSKGDGITAAQYPYEPDDDLEAVLTPYFLKSFKSNETYRLSHETDVNLNEVYAYCRNIFHDPEQFHINSIHLLKHLYNQSEHPHIKPGEVYIALFDDLVLDGELTRGIGIFKSEQKDVFIQTNDHGNFVELDVKRGIDIKKLDKGCLIFETEEEAGYRAMIVDQNHYDAQYWKDHFLGLVPDQNEAYHTKNVINLCKDFSRQVIAVDENAKEQALFMARTVEYMQDNEQFTTESFEEAVFPEAQPEMKEKFQEFKQDYQKANEVQVETDFEIADETLKQEKRKIRNTIELDTNVQIKLNFRDLNSGDKFVERGYDPERGMYYYKVFFNREKR